MKALLLATLVVTRLKQPSRRLLILLAVIVWINAMNFFLFHHRQKTFAYLTNKFNQINPLNNYDGHAIPKKLPDVGDDFGLAFNWHTFETPETMVDFYKSKFQPKAAIIPPYVNTDSLDLKNDDKNPTRPWEAGKGCENMVLCANGEIGGSGKHGLNLQKGQFLELDPKERDFIAFYGDIWIEQDAYRPIDVVCEASAC